MGSGRHVSTVFGVAGLGCCALLGWTGFSIMEVLATDYLVSLPQVSVAVVQSVIPVSAILIIVAQVCVLPEVLDEARRGDIVKEAA